MVGAEHRETGERVVIKQWRRDQSILDDDLREIWREEIRQLHRLAGYPGARDLIVTLLDAGEDADHYFLALRVGQRLPLQTVLSNLGSQHWLGFPRQDRNRLRLWHEIRRIVGGMGILHSQGLLHRNLDTWAVFTSGGDDLDFQLSGFEWSIRLIGVPESRPSRPARTLGDERVVFSFLQDWQSLGTLVAKLLDVDPRHFLLSNRRSPVRDPVVHLSGAERELILLLLRADPMERVDCDAVTERIDRIIASLTATVGKRETKLYLTCNLSATSRLSAAIREASGRTIETSDVDGQMTFVERDLGEEALLVAVREGPTAKSFVLAGRALTYRLRPFRLRNAKEPTWALAYCEEALAQRPPQPGILGHQLLENATLELLRLPEVSKRLATIQGRALAWNQIIRELPQEADSPPIRLYRALVLVQVIESLLDATEIWPVELESQTTQNDCHTIRLRSRNDKERHELAEALGLQPPAIRMHEAFANDQTPIDEDWRLTEVGVLGDVGRESSVWRFIEIEEHEGSDPYYVFEGHDQPPIGERLFLRHGNYVGDDRLLRRRIKALRALREHVELIDTLADPRAALRQTHEVIVEDAAFKSLDLSKQQALKEIWETVPLFLVQGPPGVGKTRLVRELVRRRVAGDSTSRMLLTAQSHHAVDHLLSEIDSILTPETKASSVIIRCRPKDHDGVPGPYDLHEQARTVFQIANTSALAQRAPTHIRQKLDALAQTFRQSDEDEEAPSAATRPDRSLEALLLRCANLVFASTNAGDLERLIEEKSQFDWSIVEEAGKATGVELISPLLLSHRRLLIGDHKQLPPFGTDQFRRILERPANLRKALAIGRPIVSRPFRDAGMDEYLSEDNDNDDELTSSCSDASQAFMMLETLIESERLLGTGQETRRSTARQLDRQHRMHPAIARLVSRSFYDQKLITDPDCERRFREDVPPFESIDTTKLPTSPILFVDMPYVQSTVGKKAAEMKPRYHNPDEVDAIVNVLAGLRVRDGQRPTLAVLSPYREQVRRIRDRIRNERLGKLKHLSNFAFESSTDDPAGTVDSFQGSEADLVVLSLVRNNGRAGLRALGFLADERRMNVLLSRAKWKLVLIGSVQFLQSCIQHQTPATQHQLGFLVRMLDTLSGLRASKDSKGVPYVSIVSHRNLKA